MITKHRVSNDIAMRDETDVAPLLLCLKDKKNTAHKQTETSPRDRKNIGVVFDALLPDFPIHTKTNGEKYK